MFLIVLREVYTCYIHLMTITMLIRRAWIAWNFMRCEWDWMFAQNEIVIREDWEDVKYDVMSSITFEKYYRKCKR